LEAHDDPGDLRKRLLDFHDGSERLLYGGQYVSDAAGVGSQLAVHSPEFLGVLAGHVMLRLQQPQHFLAGTRLGRYQALHLVDPGTHGGVVDVSRFSREATINVSYMSKQTDSNQTTSLTVRQGRSTRSTSLCFCEASLAVLAGALSP
jgi:hypothetical protein